MFVLSYFEKEDVCIKCNMYNRRSPTRNEYTLALNMFIKQIEDGMHIGVEDIVRLQKIHDTVFNQNFTYLDKDVLVFAATHAMGAAMTSERFKNVFEIRIKEYIMFNKPSLHSWKSKKLPNTIKMLHGCINSLLKTEVYQNGGWTSSPLALNFSKRQETFFFHNFDVATPFEPEQAYYAERDIKLNIPYTTFINWKVSITRLQGPLEKVLDDLDFLDVYKMSSDLITNIVRIFQAYLLKYRFNDDDDDDGIDIKQLTNPIQTYNKLYNILRQLSKKKEEED